jgi:hypothetical protein
MFEIVLLGYLAFRNGVRARQKGLNTILWGGLTVLSFFMAFAVGLSIVMKNFMADAVNMQLIASPDPKIRAEASKHFIDAFGANPLNSITVYAFGIGGYLLIRYILDKRPNKKQPEVHWMDKLGGDSRES